MLANNVVLFVHLYNMLVMHKNVGQQCWFVYNMSKHGQHFGYLIGDEIISDAFEDIAYKKLISFIIYILSKSLSIKHIR